MNRILGGVVALFGLVGLIIGGVSWTQFRSLATSQNPGSLKDYPIVDMIGGGLLTEATTVNPAEVASQIQFRILMIGLVGLVLLLIGFAMVILYKRSSGPGNADSN